MSVFVPTMIIPPSLAPVYIDRPVLNDLTDQVGQSRLTTIFAPAGSGKTAAALNWFNQLKAEGRPGLWLSVRSGIRDLNSFLFALKEAGVSASLPWQQLDPIAGDSAWLASLAAHERQKPVLVIDDAHLLGEDVLAFLRTSFSSFRDAMTVIITSRGAIDIPLARIRALGFLVEVDPDDLGFTASESRELVTKIAGDSLDENTLQQIVDGCMGWVSGLRIFANHYRQGKGRGIDRVFHTAVISYFNEEVLAPQSEHIRDFLVDVSILEELIPAVCAALTNEKVEDASAVLDFAFRAGLFLNRVDYEHDCYAYHPLFRKSISSELINKEPGRAAELHRRASIFYAESGKGLVAIEHASYSSDQEFFADQLDILANELIYTGYLFRIVELSSGLPWSILKSRPMLLLALAWRDIRRLSFASAERFIDAAAEIAESRPDDRVLQYLIRHRRIMLEAAHDNMEMVEVEAQKLLYELGGDEPYLSCTLLAQLMTARRELYHFHDILKLEAEMQRALDRPGSEFASIALKASVAPTLVAKGKTPQARSLLEEALELAVTRQEVGSGLAALPALPLAEILYDTGEFERAAELVDTYLPVVRQWGFVDQMASGYLVRARLAFARGDVAAALSGLEEAHLIAIEFGLDRLRAFVVAEQVRILTKTGKVSEVEAALREGGIEIEKEPLPTSTPTRKNENIAIAWIRMQLHSRRLSHAQKVATRWLEFVKRSAAARSIVTFQLLVAEIAVLQGNRTAARRAVRRAVELAEPSGWTQVFLDEGEVICSLLREAYSDDSALETTPADIFASRLVALIQGKSEVEIEDTSEEGVYLTKNFSAREIDVLTMVRGGLRNKEIGDRLGLTEGTVKWYLQQIYDKLGVRRRSQAVLRARQLGILN